MEDVRSGGLVEGSLDSIQERTDAAGEESRRAKVSTPTTRRLS